MISKWSTIRINNVNYIPESEFFHSICFLSESGVRASANAHSRSYMSMHADPS